MHSQRKDLTVDEIFAREDRQGVFFAEIVEERIAQGQKWGWQTWDGYEWITVLAEEFGEIANAILEHDHEGIKKELVQTAAVICAMYEQHTTDRSLA